MIESLKNKSTNLVEREARSTRDFTQSAVQWARFRLFRICIVDVF